MNKNRSSEKSFQKLKLIGLLKSFSSLEIKRFGRFLKSPYFNNNHSLIALFDQIRSFYPDFIHQKFKRHLIWKRLFKNTTFDPNKFKKMFFELNALAEEFLVVEEVKKEERLQQKIFIQAIKYRRYAHFEKTSLSLIAQIEAKGTSKTPDDFLDLHLLYRDLWYHIEKDKHQVDHKELAANYLQLCYYKEIEKIKTKIEYENRRKFLNIPNLPLPLDLKNASQRIALPTNETIKFLNIFQKLDKVNEVFFYYELKNQLLSSKESLDQSLLQDAVIHLSNFTIRARMNGVHELDKEAFEILKWAAENDIFIIKGRILETVFSNTIVLALKEKEIEWAKKYFEKNKTCLKSPNKLLYLHYSKAAINFTEKNFESVIVLLATLKPSHTFQFYFLIKSLLTRSFFELILKGNLNYYDPLVDQLAAFDTGLRRNRKFSQNRIAGYRNFVKIFQKMTNKNIFIKKDKTQLDQLKNLIKETNPLIASHWFTEKIEFLENNGL